MAELTEKQRAFLQEPFVATATTIRRDGSPHSTVVWIEPDDRGVAFNTARGRTKVANLERDPRATLLVVDPDDPYRWIAVSGSAELTEEGADAQIDRLARKYLGEDYPWRRPDETRVSVVIRAEKVDSSGLDG